MPRKPPFIINTNNITTDSQIVEFSIPNEFSILWNVFTNDELFNGFLLLLDVRNGINNAIPIPSKILTRTLIIMYVMKLYLTNLK